jgi:site-specific DNA recombinase
MSKTSTPTRVAIYARLSDDREGKGTNVDLQIKACQELAERLGWEVAHVFKDKSKSAYTGKRRDEYQAMFQGIQDGLYDGLIAWGNDRLTRIPRELEDLIDLIEGTGIQIQTVVSGEYDLNTADGRATARIHCAISRQESEKKSERVKAKKAVQIANGETSGDKQHTGVEVRSAFVPEEIAVVREMGRRVLAGESVSGITKWLNEEDISTSQGRPWTRATVRQLLLNPATAGLRKQPDGGVVEGNWEGAWDKDTWNRLCGILHDPSRKTTDRLRNYLLTGLVHDPSARKMVTGHDKRGRIYRTDTTMGKTTGGASIGADLVEEVVTVRVLDASDKIVLTEPEAENPFALVESLQAEFVALGKLYGDGEIDAEVFNTIRLPLQARIKEARKSVKVPTSLVTDWGVRGQLRAEWDGLSLAQKRSAIEGFVERITILPAHGEGRKTAAQRVFIEWKVPVK